jgi:hypothetical protein
MPALLTSNLCNSLAQGVYLRALPADAPAFLLRTREKEYRFA